MFDKEHDNLNVALFSKGYVLNWNSKFHFLNKFWILLGIDYLFEGLHTNYKFDWIPNQLPAKIYDVQLTLLLCNVWNIYPKENKNISSDAEVFNSG